MPAEYPSDYTDPSKPSVENQEQYRGNTPAPGSNPPTASSLSPGDPSDPNRKKKEAADQFPSKWEKDRELINIYFIADVDNAAAITRKIYRAIDQELLSASLYIEKSEYSVVVGGSLIKNKKREDANEERNELLVIIKHILQAPFKKEY